jgi:hypothetical protein
MTLTHEGILALVFVGAVLAMILISICISWFLNYIDKKRRKQHPMLFILQEQANEASARFWNWRTKEINTRKNKIDKILADMPYYPKEVKAQKEEEVEKLRREVYVAMTTDKVLKEELDRCRKATRDYIKKHNITWMENWGCD